MQPVYGKVGLLIALETSQSHSVFLIRQEEEERSLLLWDEFYVLQREEVRRRRIREGLYHTRATNFATSLTFTCMVLTPSNPNLCQHPGYCTAITGERGLLPKRWEMDDMAGKEELEGWLTNDVMLFPESVLQFIGCFGSTLRGVIIKKHPLCLEK